MHDFPSPDAERNAKPFHDLLQQRVAVLDGAWGTMLQGAGLTAADYRGERLADHPHDVTGDPDLLNLTRPDVILDVHRQYLAAGADITTTNTFTATSIGQADYGLQPLVREMNLRGRPAGPAGRRRGRRPVRRRLDRPAERHAVAVAAGGRPGLPRGDVRPGPRRLRRADPGAGRGRRRPAADRDDLRHAQREGRDRRRPRGRPAPAAVDLGHDRRPERADAVRADRRGVLELDRARPAAGRRRELLAGRRGDAPARRRTVPAGRHVHGLPPNAGLPNAFGGYDQTPDETARLLGEFAAAGMVNIVGGCCGTTPGAHRADRRPPCPAWRPAQVAGAAGAHPVQRPGAVRDRRRTPAS